MGRRKPQIPRISGARSPAQARRWRRSRHLDSVEKKKSNHISIREIPMKTKNDFVSPIYGRENINTSLQSSSIISPKKSRGCIPHIDNTLCGSRGYKRKWENQSAGEGKKGIEKKYREESHRGHFTSPILPSNESGLLKSASNTHEIHSELNGQKSSRSRKWRRHHKVSGASADILVSREGLEERSIVKSLGDNSMVPVPRAIRSQARKKLLVLDLNGLLCDVVHGNPKTHTAHKRVGKSAVFKRPFCDGFMKFCCEKFHIGVWSSRKMENVCGVVNFIMRDIRDNLMFCWDASMCTYTGCKTIEHSNKPLVLKQLKKLWNKEGNNLPWEKGDFSPSNTVLLDDSPYKALCNPPYTGIFPHPYSYTDEGDNSLGPGGDLRCYLEGLALADDVQCYIQAYPFGRVAITCSDPHWKFYEQIINKINYSSCRHMAFG